MNLLVAKLCVALRIAKHYQRPFSPPIVGHRMKAMESIIQYVKGKGGEFATVEQAVELAKVGHRTVNRHAIAC